MAVKKCTKMVVNGVRPLRRPDVTEDIMELALNKVLIENI